MAILDVRDLSIDYIDGDGRVLHAVEQVSFYLEHRRSLGLVGESGCGKTTTMLGLLRLLPAEGRIVSGEVWYDAVDLLGLSERQMQDYRWKSMAIVFQSAMNALNPVRRIGDQIAEAIVVHERVSRAEAQQRAGELLEMVGISGHMARRYPHQYSGGMRQRAMTAMALACSPGILIADEPTTALDVMIQAQILDLFQRLQKQLDLAIILVTHDLGVVAELCDDVLVLYGGRTVEYAGVDAIFNEPLHPYTQRLMQAFPDIERPTSTLAAIPGYPPPLDALPPGCRFEPRCLLADGRCALEKPPLVAVKPGHYVACYRVEEGTNAARATS